MDTNQIRLELQGFRAIQDANIILNGITVVAGENGSGKSTLSQFLYYVFKISNNYEALVNESLQKQLYEVKYFLERLNRAIVNGASIEKSSFFVDLDWVRLFEKEEEWLTAVDLVFSNYEEKIDEKRKKMYAPRFYHLRKILEDILGNDDKETNNTTISELSFSDLALPLKEYIRKHFSSAADNIRNRPSEIVENTLKMSFSTNALPQKYAIIEYGIPIISEKKRIEKAHSVRQVAYIDTPMLLGVSNSKYSYWNDTNAIVKSENRQEYISDHTISSMISKDIIKGDASYETGENSLFDKRFIYKREDGFEFNLLDCATGVKSFAILQMMLKNGFLNKHSLLIVDEPESHLHPQWIIEYARLLVLLNKHIGVKFFIASHNPDMVSAIKYISEAESVDENLNFYIAAPVKEKSHLYTYKHLGTDIEPIFESFNIALDRISLYGTKNEDETKSEE